MGRVGIIEYPDQRPLFPRFVIGCLDCFRTERCALPSICGKRFGWDSELCRPRVEGGGIEPKVVETGP